MATPTNPAPAASTFTAAFPMTMQAVVSVRRVTSRVCVGGFESAKIARAW